MSLTRTMLGKCGAKQISILAPSGSTCVSYSARSFSVLKRPPPNYPGHVPLSTIERGALAVGSALGSLLNPQRAGMGHYHCPLVASTGPGY